MIFALMVVPVLGLFFGVHRYLWCRLVRDTTTPGSRLRRTGTLAAFVLPLFTPAALLSARAGTPFPLQQALAWPGYLWLALVLYLTLALLVGEVVRAVCLRAVRARERTEPDPLSSPAHGPEPRAQTPPPTPEPTPDPHSTLPPSPSPSPSPFPSSAPTLLPPRTPALPPLATPPAPSS
ncbi:hypothetical protein ACIPXV_06100 [Streptomyces libani]|uniref:hypothetical protein n=1 Tax=Streptomyces nigrescens TaxID=1920 RepID=UPI0038023EC1